MLMLTLTPRGKRRATLLDVSRCKQGHRYVLAPRSLPRHSRFSVDPVRQVGDRSSQRGESLERSRRRPSEEAQSKAKAAAAQQNVDKAIRPGMRGCTEKVMLARDTERGQKAPAAGGGLCAYGCFGKSGRCSFLVNKRHKTLAVFTPNVAEANPVVAQSH